MSGKNKNKWERKRQEKCGPLKYKGIFRKFKALAWKMSYIHLIMCKKHR
jgi:hypothetical protein